MPDHPKTIPVQQYIPFEYFSYLFVEIKPINYIIYTTHSTIKVKNIQNDKNNNNSSITIGIYIRKETIYYRLRI